MAIAGNRGRPKGSTQYDYQPQIRIAADFKISNPECSDRKALLVAIKRYGVIGSSADSNLTALFRKWRDKDERQKHIDDAVDRRSERHRSARGMSLGANLDWVSLESARLASLTTAMTPAFHAAEAAISQFMLDQRTTNLAETIQRMQHLEDLCRGFEGQADPFRGIIEAFERDQALLRAAQGPSFS